MKITIIGPSGGGKSTLSRKISQKFNIPRFEIDRVWFKHGGQLSMNGTSEEKESVSQRILVEIEQFLSANENWVFDGTYSKLQPVIAEQADTVVLIQRPLLGRILSHVRRVLGSDNRHPEVTPLSDLGFVRTIFKRWRKQENKKLNNFVGQYQEKLVILESFKEIDSFFEELERRQGRT